jgi:hypothetical protein
MASDLADVLRVLLELLFYWRYWLPIALAGVAVFVLFHFVPEGSARTLATVAILVAGFFAGHRWQQRHEEREELR